VCGRETVRDEVDGPTYRVGTVPVSTFMQDRDHFLHSYNAGSRLRTAYKEIYFRRN